MQFTYLFLISFLVLVIAVEAKAPGKPKPKATGKTKGNTKTKTKTKTQKTSSTSCAPSDTPCSSCFLAFSTLDVCSSRLANFDDISDDQAAQCLCYNPASSNHSSSIWEPNQFDAPYSFCTQWASTADSDDISDYRTGLGFCSSVGNVLRASSSNLASSVTATSIFKGTGTSTASAGSAAGAATASSTTKPKSAASGLEARLVAALLAVFGVSLFFQF